MKFKKLLISASAVAAGSGLLATVLTSCAKADIDEDLKIELDDAGKLFDESKLDPAKSKIDYTTAIKNALTRSSTWVTFKEALAEEIIYQWYEDRASKDKDDKTRNQGFRTTLNGWKYDADKTYNDNLDSCKSKYGANYKFYFQNEYLAPNGGTEENYKRSLMLANIKSDFISKVFATSYFGVAKAAPSNEGTLYPHIFTEASTDVSRFNLNDPTLWPRIGFYAKVNKSFDPGDGTNIDPDYLSRKPDGDYAIVQNYVFNRWFKTEKPFFSSAALFKYSNPAQSGGKLENIYNADTGITLPTDNPNETFPFFGGVKITSNAYTGTNAYWQWYQALLNGSFETPGLYRGAPNGSVSISKKYTEDSQTVLLCSATQMIGGDSALYVPYAISAASLYNQMMDPTHAVAVNEMTSASPHQDWGGQDILQANVGEDMPAGEDDARILKNFFFQPTKPTYITSFIDLNNVYGGLNGTGTVYHCPLFKSDSSYKFFYGDSENESGVRYITNSVQVKLGKGVYSEGDLVDYTNQQPWILELNEAGMHAQTIDGYRYISNPSSFDPNVTDKQEASKNFIKYRLMQKLHGYDNGVISADLLDGQSPKLKTYFENNFADIILEMATKVVSSTDSETNIFRKIDSYKEIPNDDDKVLFLDIIAYDQKLASDADSLTAFKTYLDKTTTFGINKKCYDAIIKANDTIYGYRKTQIDNSKTSVGTKKFENGLLAPIAYGYEASATTLYNTTHQYDNVVELMDPNGVCTYTALEKLLISGDGTAANPGIESLEFVTNAMATGYDNDSAFSPQIKEAKKVESNRFWYKSRLVDKLMYAYMGNHNTANGIKYNTYDYYLAKAFDSKVDKYNFQTIKATPEFKNAQNSIYIGSKLLTGDKNFASYASSPTGVDFYTTMANAFEQKINDDELQTGQNINDTNLDECAFWVTVSYLAKNGFEHFYDQLSTKIPGNDKAFIGYLSKYDIYGITDLAEARKAFDINSTTTISATPFDWEANIDNIFDQAGYAGGTAGAIGKPARVGFDQYWRVINKKFIPTQTAKTMSGFLGLQTSNNVLIDDLKTAVFNDLSESVADSPILSTAGVDKHEINDGALFAWAIPAAAADDYKFGTITWKKGTSEEKSISDLAFGELPEAMKLANKIAKCSTIDDLKDLAKSIGESLDGYTLFDRIADSTLPMDEDPINGYKYEMLTELSGGYDDDYDNAFERLVDTQIHGPIGDNSSYLFEDGNNGYKLMLTQLNKADIEEKLLAPTYHDSAWDFSKCPITPDEFWYLLCQMATESSVQQSAIADAVKFCYGESKLIVYDAQLYNQFDSVWIKDWVKKPIGQ